MFESLNGYNFILVALNLIILYVVLRKILFKPVTAFMENRTLSIRNSIENAEKQKAEAEELRFEYEKQLKNAKAEAEKIVAEGHAKAVLDAEKVIGDAKREASLILKNAGEEIEHERAQMLKDIRNEVAELAILAASKLMEENMSTAKNMQFVNDFLDKEGVA
ncbi:MAG: F0F1 ATP synthase subunit B [Bacillota bacterium]|nr:F0F1 ATP synthase subunit B [Bacillota bacterium]